MNGPIDVFEWERMGSPNSIGLHEHRNEKKDDGLEDNRPTCGDPRDYYFQIPEWACSGSYAVKKI